MTNIAVFASGTGTNAVNIVKTFNSGTRLRVVLCLTDKENAPVIEKMRELGVETIYFPRYVWREEPETILSELHAHDIRMIALAGFLCFVSDRIVTEYEGRILNIHPSLLPAYGGKGMHGSNVHRAVIEAGETKSGATVHLVTDKLDSGDIVDREEVPVLPDDTPDTLEARVHEAEYRLYPRAILKIAKTIEAPQPAEAAGDRNSANVPEAPSAPEPPAIPKNIDDEWAETLGVPNNVPPLPNQPIQPQPAFASPGQQAPVWGTQFAAGPKFSQSSSLNRNAEPMPPTWLVWSVVITILCCFIPGIVAIIYSSKVSGRYYAGDIEGARKASENAEIWIIVSFVLGVISNTLYIPLTIAGLL